MEKIIKYNSDTKLPPEINDAFNTMMHRVFESKYEEDKIFINMEHFKGYLIRWFSEHAERAERKEG